MITFNLLVAGITDRMNRLNTIRAKAPNAPVKSLLANSIASITHIPQMNAASHFVRKKQNRYWPTVSFHVLRISCGTL